MFYTTDELVNSIKIRSLAPFSESAFTDEDVIVLLNEELQINLLPDILSAREDFFLQSKLSPVVGSISNYTLPERAIGNSLKQVFLVDANNNRTTIINTDIGIKNQYLPTLGYPAYFFFLGDEISLVPTPQTSGGNIEMWYFARPNQLVPTGNVAKITGFTPSGANQILNLDTDLTASITANSTKLDILSAKSPFVLWSQDITCSAITTSTATVVTTDISNAASVIEPQIGDYVCLAQQANIPMIPQEFHPILAEMVNARLMAALGDRAKLENAMNKVKEMRTQAFQMIANRTEQQPKKILNRNGLSRNSGFRSWGNY